MRRWVRASSPPHALTRTQYGTDLLPEPQPKARPRPRHCAKPQPHRQPAPSHSTCTLDPPYPDPHPHQRGRAQIINDSILVELAKALGTLVEIGYGSKLVQPLGLLCRYSDSRVREAAVASMVKVVQAGGDCSDIPLIIFTLAGQESSPPRVSACQLIPPVYASNRDPLLANQFIVRCPPLHVCMCPSFRGPRAWCSPQPGSAGAPLQTMTVCYPRLLHWPYLAPAGSPREPW